MNIPGAEEQGPQKLQRHVVQLHVVADHVRQLLDHRRLPAALRRSAEES